MFIPDLQAYTIVPRDLGSAINSTFNPSQGNGTFADEIKCYSLPYGGIGILSHVLTYYTVIALICGRKPFLPGMELTASIWDALISILALLGSCVIAGKAIANCVNQWQISAIAFWKLMLSLSFSLLGISAPFFTAAGGSAPGVIWIVPYLIGTVCGSVGLFSIMHELFGADFIMRRITYALLGYLGFTAFVAMLFVCGSRPKDSSTGVSLMMGLLFILCAFELSLVFFSDVTLAAVADNLVGAPSPDVAVAFWLYFIFKRLPMLSW